MVRLSEIINTTLILIPLLAGVFFMFIGALGLVRMPDVYNRMHTSTKAITLGVSGIMLATALTLDTTEVWLKAALVIAFQFVTAPAGAHMISRSASRIGVKAAPSTVVDERPAELSGPVRRSDPDA